MGNRWSCLLGLTIRNWLLALLAHHHTLLLLHLHLLLLSLLCLLLFVVLLNVGLGRLLLRLDLNGHLHDVIAMAASSTDVCKAITCTSWHTVVSLLLLHGLLLSRLG